MELIPRHTYKSPEETFKKLDPHLRKAVEKVYSRLHPEEQLFLYRSLPVYQEYEFIVKEMKRYAWGFVNAHHYPRHFCEQMVREKCLTAEENNTKDMVSCFLLLEARLKRVCGGKYAYVLQMDEWQTIRSFIASEAIRHFIKFY
jgi:hypothetical protein